MQIVKQPYITSLTLLTALVACASVLTAGATSVEAHGSGESFEKEVPAGVIDIGYSTTEFTDDDTVVFDFKLTDIEDETPVPFTDVWTRVIREERTVFASGVHNAEFGGAIMTYQFPEPGEYTLAVRYQHEGETVAEAEFPLTVERGRAHGGATNDLLALLGTLIIGLAAGFGAARIFSRRRNEA